MEIDTTKIQKTYFYFTTFTRPRLGIYICVFIV